jgi:hypothetical protein
MTTHVATESGVVDKGHNERGQGTLEVVVGLEVTSVFVDVVPGTNETMETEGALLSRNSVSRPLIASSWLRSKSWGRLFLQAALPLSKRMSVPSSEKINAL